MAFMPEHAPVVALAFLAAGMLAGGGVVLFVGLRLAGRPRGALRALGVPVAAGVLYVTGLGSASLSSADRVLGTGEAKYFCEIDCHLAVTLVDVRVEESLGAGESLVAAAGRFHVVTVRAWFDERTVSSRRPAGAPLYSGPREVAVVDGTGRVWRVSSAGQSALGEPESALDRQLVPGAWYEARYVFDLPEDVRGPRLLVADRSLVSRFLIGHENSPFHGRVLFDLSPAEPGAGRVTGGGSGTFPSLGVGA